MLRYLKSINEELNVSKLSDEDFDKLVKKVIKNLYVIIVFIIIFFLKKKYKVKLNLRVV